MRPLWFLIVGLAVAGGCAGPIVGDPTGLKFKEPDSKFLKQVERDPFPRGDAATPVGR
jgi:hypothetical protein